MKLCRQAAQFRNTDCLIVVIDYYELIPSGFNVYGSQTWIHQGFKQYILNKGTYWFNLVLILTNLRLGYIWSGRQSKELNSYGCWFCIWFNLHNSSASHNIFSIPMKIEVPQSISSCRIRDPCLLQYPDPRYKWPKIQTLDSYAQLSLTRDSSRWAHVSQRKMILEYTTRIHAKHLRCVEALKSQ